MRDQELIGAFERLTPRLDKLFSYVMRMAHGDLAVEVDDLIQETGKGALINSRLPQYDTYTCESLIWEKAYKLAWEYGHPPQKKVPALSIENAENKEAGQDAYRDLVSRQWLQHIYHKVDRKTWIIFFLMYAGYKQHEIATNMGMKLSVVKKTIYETRQKLT